MWVWAVVPRHPIRDVRTTLPFSGCPPLTIESTQIKFDHPPNDLSYQSLDSRTHHHQLAIVNLKLPEIEESPNLITALRTAMRIMIPKPASIIDHVNDSHCVTQEEARRLRSENEELASRLRASSSTATPRKKGFFFWYYNVSLFFLLWWSWRITMRILPSDNRRTSILWRRLFK